MLKKCHGTVPFLPRIPKIALVFLNNLFWVNLDFWGGSASGSGEVGSQKEGGNISYIYFLELSFSGQLI